jgi:hypothetical protein
MSSPFSFVAGLRNFQGDKMKNAHFTKGLFFGASLLLASAAVAGEKASVKVYEDVKLNGKTITAGKYDLAWEGTGSNVQVSITRGKEVVATLPAQVETSQSASATTGYSTRKEGDGSKSVTNFFFAGKKYTLNLNQQEATAPAQAASNPGNK